MGIADLFSGPKVLEERESKINGKISVVKTLGLGTYIQVEGLTQSGSVINDVWRTTLRKVKKSGYEVENCLILGLGGGSVAKWVGKFWPEAEITGVEIDPVMIELGKKYMGLAKLNADIKVVDASDFIKKEKRKYDLILVDMYVGYEVPEEFTSQRFIKRVKGLLKNKGIAVFNRLYFGEKRTEAMKFAEKLEKEFSEVKYIYPEANVMFVCG
jgi:spermidine synthase